MTLTERLRSGTGADRGRIIDCLLNHDHRDLWNIALCVTGNLGKGVIFKPQHPLSVATETALKKLESEGLAAGYSAPNGTYWYPSLRLSDIADVPGALLAAKETK